MVRLIKAIIGRLPRWLLTILVLALILWLTLAPHPLGKVHVPLFKGADKVAHLIMFAALSFSFNLDWMRVRHWQRLSLPEIACVALGVGVFGIFIELAQRTMGMGRSFEVLDMVADGAGAMIGAAVWAVLNGLFSDDKS